MINLKNITFVIPIKIDSDDRYENVQLLINYLNHNFDTNIIIGENDEYPKCLNLGDTDHVFLESDGGAFHKTKVLNELYKASPTDIICAHDSDVFTFRDQYIEGVNYILNRDNQCSFLIGYDGSCFNVPRDFIYRFHDFNFSSLNTNRFKRRRNNSNGGLLFFNKSDMINIGMENEYFRGWGGEDDERIVRIGKFGYSIPRISGPIFHLNHVVSPNANRADINFKSNLNELQKIRSLTSDKLKEYVCTWNWNPN